MCFFAVPLLAAIGFIAGICMGLILDRPSKNTIIRPENPITKRGTDAAPR